MNNTSVSTRSMFNIRQDHLSLLEMIEEQDGTLEPEQEEALRLTEEDFKDKAISYGFIILQLQSEADIVDQEIKRLKARKDKVESKAERFKTILDEAMRQFGHEKIASPTLTLSYRPSTPVELAESFQDDLLKYADVSITLNAEKMQAAIEAGESPQVSAELLELFDLKVQPNKTRIGEALKAGVNVPGAARVEKKNLQIK